MYAHTRVRTQNALCNGTTDGRGNSGRPWLPAPPYAPAGFWSLPEPWFRTKIYECSVKDSCEGGGGNLDGNSTCAPGYAGRICSQCAEDYYMSFGSCRACQNKALNVAFILAVWCGWYIMNSVLAENIETADQFLSFIQACTHFFPLSCVCANTCHTV